MLAQVRKLRKKVKSMEENGVSCRTRNVQPMEQAQAVVPPPPAPPPPMPRFRSIKYGAWKCRCQVADRTLVVSLS